jgi:hypothetical protein
MLEGCEYNQSDNKGKWNHSFPKTKERGRRAVPRPVLVFVTVIAIAALIAWPAGVLVRPTFFWTMAIVAAAVLAIVSRGRTSVEDGRIAALLPEKGDFICDRCRHNLDSACSTPGRPNLTRCSAYRPTLRDR